MSISKYNGIGVTQPVNLTTYAPNSKIVIGNDVGMSGCTIHAMENVEIGNEVLIGSGVLIMDNDAHPIDPENRRYSKKKIHTAPVKIGDNVFLGARAIILKGVTIGDGSVIGAGSVVTKNIPPYVIAAGNPARVVGTVT